MSAPATPAPARRAPRVVGLDDFFPNLATGFRVAEFNWHLERGSLSDVMTTAGPFTEVLGPYSAVYPGLADHVVPYSADRLAEYDLAYTLFLNNAAHFLDDLTSHDVPFVVTLFPGGGLDLGSPDAEAKLGRVLSSPLLRHIITTQSRVTRHVRDLVGSTVPITEIPGVPTNPVYETPGAGMRRDYFGVGKDTLDLCFVAYRYTATGADKGYPEFIDLVRRVRAAGLPVSAHVVGGFGPDVVPVDDLADVLRFSGPLPTSQLREAYLGKDVIVSPNRPDVLSPGAFDGFPLGTCIEAALCGVAVLASDPLQQNTLFRDGRDILIERPSGEAMAERLLSALREPGALERIGQAGLRTARARYGAATQLGPRSALIASVADAVVAPPAAALAG